MAKKSTKKIVIGFILICLAGFILLSSFYYMEVKPEMDTRSKSAQTKVDASKQKVTERAAEIKKTQEGEVDVNRLVKEAEAVYGPEEKNRKEGVLWIDHKSSNAVVTLGALNGILPGKQLNVYSGDQKVGQVIVDSSFDVISYVHPESTTDLSQNDYYRVVVE